ncbi:MAG: YdcF family protein [Christensenellales bacterium]|jgi:uncharacterized SAM-binding protein YcdF (DUF218 family)
MTKTPSAFLNSLFLFAAICCFAYYLANGLLVRFGQSILWVWPVLGALLLLRFTLVAYMIRTGAPSPIPHGILKIGRILVAVALVVFSIGEAVILTGAFEKTPARLEYIIILGAKVNGKSPSGALRNRIQRAAEYMQENPDTIAIASGGQGEDEEISEAQCIYNGLVARGIDPSRILFEDKSTSTVENMRFSFQILFDLGKHGSKVGIVTNNFHVFRALRIARKHAGACEVRGVPVATTKLSFPHYMLREFVAVIVDFLRGSL